VWVNGRRAALVGTVSMDMITVDLTGREDVAVGDPVELWGPNVPVNEVAACAGTIGYDLLAGMTSRLPREYTESG
jgi:alanine racemase